jgi:hypothetical protein
MFSLKRLQVIDLLTNRGTFASLNVSIPTVDFLDVINEFEKLIFNGATMVNFYWLWSKHTSFSEIITDHGLCSTFNIAFSTELLDTHFTTDDFHYQNIISNFESNVTEVIPRRSARSAQNLRVDIFSDNITQSRIVSAFEGCMMYWHNPYELPSRFSQKRLLSFAKFTDIWIEPQMIVIDESLESDEPEE